MPTITWIADKLMGYTKDERSLLKKLLQLSEYSLKRLEYVLKSIDNDDSMCTVITRGMWKKDTLQPILSKPKHFKMPTITWMSLKLFEIAENERSCLKYLINLSEETLEELKKDLAQIDLEENLESLVKQAKWVKMSDRHLLKSPVLGGKENGVDLWVGRARHEGALIPGKIITEDGVCYIGTKGKEHKKQEYEALCCPKSWELEWVKAADLDKLFEAVEGGFAENGEILYIGRALHLDKLIIGKVLLSTKLCYIPYCGEEIAKAEFEVLVIKSFQRCYWTTCHR